MALTAWLIQQEVERHPSRGACGQIDRTLLLNRANRCLVVVALVEIIHDPQFVQRPARTVDDLHLKTHPLAYFGSQRPCDQHGNGILCKNRRTNAGHREASCTQDAKQMTQHRSAFSPWGGDALTCGEQHSKRPVVWCDRNAKSVPRRQAVAHRRFCPVRMPRATTQAHWKRQAKGVGERSTSLGPPRYTRGDFCRPLAGAPPQSNAL